jgi:SAM-dependent methyltransferase
MTGPPGAAVVWHDLECGSYRADLGLWSQLAREHGGRVLDVGAGAGRVSVELAREGIEVVALDRDPELLGALERRARGLPLTAVLADARDFSIPRRFGLIIAPMQTVQLLDGPAGRAAFLRLARAHLAPGGVLAAALAEDLEDFSADLPLPPADLAVLHGWTWRSQPTGLRADGARVALERLREAVAPDGARTVTRDVVHLDRVDADELEAQGAAIGLRALPRRVIDPTEEHVGSVVVLLGAGAT